MADETPLPPDFRTPSDTRTYQDLRPDFSISRFKDGLAKAGGLARGMYFTAQVVGGPFGTTIDIPSIGLLGNIPLQQYWAMFMPWFALPLPTPTDAQHQVMMCRAARMPDLSLQTTELSFHSRKVKIPSSRTYEPLTLTFLHVNDTKVRHKFEQWLNIMNHPSENMAAPIAVDKPSTHFAQILLTQYDMSGRSWVDFLVDVTQGKAKRESRAINHYVFRDAFPVNVSGIVLNHEADTEIQTYDVQFQFQHVENPSFAASRYY